MLRNLDDLTGYALRATDGDIGTVKDFYIDDGRWTVRYLVVETGTWLASRKVLVSPVSLGAPNHEDRVLTVSITREQVRNSPDIDTDKPVSRQHEIDYLGYYGYPSYWDGAGIWGAGALPGLMMPDPGFVGGDALADKADDPSLAAELAARHAHDDPHLRSCKSITGYHLKARDGEIGHVDGWIVDEDTWAVRYLVVDTSNWWMGHRVLLAPQWISDVSWPDAVVNVEMTRQAIESSPPWDASLPTREQEMGLYAHYDRSGYW